MFKFLKFSRFLYNFLLLFLNYVFFLIFCTFFYFKNFINDIYLFDIFTFFSSLKVTMGLGNFEPAPAPAASTGLSSQSKMNNMVLQKIQALVAANPQFLTSGIPNQLLQQLLMQPMKVK